MELIIRNWRISCGIPRGKHVWFDLTCEAVKLYRLGPLDSEDVLLGYCGVARVAQIGHVDTMVSVSGSEQEQEPLASERFEQLDWTDCPDELPF